MTLRCERMMNGVVRASVVRSRCEKVRCYSLVSGIGTVGLYWDVAVLYGAPAPL